MRCWSGPRRHPEPIPRPLSSQAADMAIIYDRFGSVVRTYTAEDDGTFHLAVEQHMDDAVDENKRLAENQTGKEVFRLVARVPVSVAEQAMREGWYHDDAAWRK